MTEQTNVSGSGETAGQSQTEVKKPFSDFKTYGAEGEDKVEAAKVAEITPDSDDPEDNDVEGGDDDVEHDDENGDKAKKPKRGGFQKKIARLEAEIERLKTPVQPAKAEQTAEVTPVKAERPKLENFKTYDSYVEALTDYKAKEIASEVVGQKLQERDNQSKEQTQKQELRAKVEKFDAAINEAREKYDDFDEVTSGIQKPTQELGFALLDSDMSGELAYELAKNPELYDRILKMQPLQMVRELGKLEATIASKIQKPTAEVKNKVTKAPAPISPVGGTTKSGGYEATDSYEAYKAKRQAGKL